MRVLIHYKQSTLKDAFEGTRMRKTLKGECERVGVSWVEDKTGEPDIVHLISSKDEPVLQRFSKNGAKIVISAFYAEHELHENFLDLDRFGRISLNPMGAKLLNQADLVFVPTIAAKKLCVDGGVKTTIKVAPVPVNAERFEVDELEKQLFLRYFGVSPERKYVLITGNFHEKRKIGLVKGLARAFPKLRFYFFGEAYSKEDWLIHHYKNSATENLKFSRIVSDDVYRSAMLHASAYLVLNSLPDGVSIMEAFAAKTPVIALGDQSLNPSLIDGVTAKVCPNEKSLLEALEKVQKGEDKQTTIPAFAIATRNNLERAGEALKANYEKLLTPKEDIE